MARDPSRAAGGWTRGQIAFLALIMLVMVNNYLDRFILTILQEPIKADLGLSDIQLGLISGPAFALLYSAVGIPFARLADRANRVTLLSCAVAFWSTMTALCGAAGGFVQLALARVGVGIGEGACTPTAHSLLSDHFSPRQRGLAMAWLSTSIPIAATLAPMLGGMIAHSYGWRTAFVAAGIPGLIIAVIFFLFARDPKFQRNGEQAGAATALVRPTFLQDLKWLFTNKAFVLIFVGSAFTGMAISGTNVFSASFLLREYGLTLKTAGAIMALSLGGAGLLGTFIGGWAADRFAGKTGRSYALIPAFGATVACFLFLGAYSAGTWTTAAILLVIANTFSDLKNGPSFAIVQNMVPDHMRATGAAILMLGLTFLGTASGPIIVGAISDLTAAAAFPDALGSFSDACRSGGAPDVADACAEASATGIKTALTSISFIYLLVGISFYLASRFLSVDLDKPAPAA